MGCGCSIPDRKYPQTLLDNIDADIISLKSVALYKTLVEDDASSISIDEVLVEEAVVEKAVAEEAVVEEEPPPKYNAYYAYSLPQRVSLRERQLYPPVHTPYNSTTDISRKQNVDKEEGYPLINLTQSLLSTGSVNDISNDVVQLKQNLNELRARSNENLKSVTKNEGLGTVVSEFISGMLRNSQLHLQIEQNSNCRISALQLFEQSTGNLNTVGSQSSQMRARDLDQNNSWRLKGHRNSIQNLICNF